MAAGLGFKTFNTGDVLSAADVNGYLMQGVLVFADAAARTAAITSPQEGQVSFLKDTNSTEYYSGSAWVAIGGGSVPTSLEFTAGKNKIINGDFRVNQRSFSSSTSDGYGLDRWASYRDGGTVTYSVQTFTLGSAPVAGYEAANFARIVTASQSASNHYADLVQFIEDVRTFAGQTATISFWAKAASGTPKIAIEFNQRFGSGGSPSSIVNTYAGQVTLSTSWARYSITVSVPSISGKTIGTTANTSSLEINMWVSAGADFNARTGSLGLQNNTFDIWGVQLEAGSTATSFQTATGTIQGELAACQRYYYRNFPAVTDIPLGQGSANGTRYILGVIALPVSMRVAPTSAEFSALKATDGATAASTVAALASYGNSTTTATYYFDCTSGLTQYRNYKIETSSSAGYLGFSAEL